MEQGLLRHLIDVLAMPDSINGKRRQFRIGYKYECFGYLKEASICKAIAEAMGEPKLASPAARKGDNRSPLTEDIMRSLDKLGLLLVEHDGRTYSYKTALFTVDWYDHRAFRPDPPKPLSELVLETDPATVILLIKGPLAHLAKLPDCRLIPRIVRPLMGTHKAINKAQTIVESSLAAAPVAPPPEEIIDKEPETLVDSDGKVPPITKEVEIAPPVEFESSAGAASPGAAPTSNGLAEETAWPSEPTTPDDQIEPEHRAPQTVAPPPSANQKPSTGLKRRSDASRRQPDEEVDVLASILSLQAAAEERAAAKKRAAPPASPPSTAGQTEKPPSPSTNSDAALESTGSETASAPPVSAGSADTPARIASETDVRSDAAAGQADRPASTDRSAKSGQLLEVHHAVSELGIATQTQSNSRGELFLSCVITPELSNRLAEIMSEIAIRPRKDIRVLTDRNTGARYLVYEKTC